MAGETPKLAQMLMVAGVLLFLLGLALLLSGKLPWLGRLPGDIVWRRGNTTVHLPIVTCLLLSLLLTALLSLWRR